nr:Gp15 family bacteriophage protein [uncultured Schaedlerella sp.]
MIGALPETLSVGGEDYSVRADYRNILQTFEAFQDPELKPAEKWIVAIYLIFEKFSCADDVIHAAQDGFDLEEAQERILWFISAGQPEESIVELPVYNWTQDEQMIFSAVNKVAGKETRELDYLHWWTFLGYFNEIGEGTFSFIVGIRDKLNNHKKLEKHEREFVMKNKKLVKLESPKTESELAEEMENQAIRDEVFG